MNEGINAVHARYDTCYVMKTLFSQNKRVSRELVNMKEGGQMSMNGGDKNRETIKTVAQGVYRAVDETLNIVG